ncbi:M13-type metalloendopeptidase [Clostridium beijerinckii]|jgi:putative endopeptidase|uniref:M13 family metallopeptidase n=1 Tax=Clostridium beijerinckii TaxID=1520 RepID=A0AAW3WA81_CLOBE|nr:M13 family metallopeptidase [Clostridium beijerinckii]MBC2458200.1 M13 family metallopeptidase [Clostridium beijerinckii]MBC2475502.1 M13 family metallopeptidase [Clostridium beijerinckii]MCI1478631.1 M13 family metallopeptidase [Clostridium beijerinckii]MCI1579611.1 M13 family metallopeptidase [Clostridium beijerinckii]MCI1581831.1 M13 family metallopeptidase [Clostridium beijerinckii]
MKKIKKLSIVASIVAFMLVVSNGSHNVAMAEESSVTNNSQGVRLNDDFYDAVNSDWIKNAKIEDGKSTASTFDDVENKVTEQIKDIINNLLINKDAYKENSDEKKIINIYNNTLNIEARNREGIKPVKENLDEIKSIGTIDDITKLWKDKRILNSTIKFSVEKDIKDVKTNILYISPTALSLGDSDEYTNPTENSKKERKLTEDYYNKILMLSGYTQQESQKKVDDMFKFEEMVAPYIKGKKEKATTKNLIDEQYNVYTVAELNNLAPNLNLSEIMNYMGIDKANKIILEDPEWLKAFNKLYNQENLPLIKNYIEIVNLLYASNYLSEDFENANKEYASNMLGITGNVSKEEEAVDNVNSMMGMAIGRLYSEKYVPEKTKKDVESITKDIIAVYKKRIDNLDWMSSQTKKNAIDKLDKLKIKIAYPDSWNDYSKLDIKSYEEGGSLFQNAMTLRIFERDKMFNKINKLVDKDEDQFKPQTVNAFYSATENSIIIPGGIIQGHFYDVNAPKEVNLGGIGVIIGHEISHAFDNTGAQYDSDGNLNNWWTEEDYKEFMQKTQKVANFYSQIEAMPGEKLDGNLTVGENIADIGGVSCLLDILGEMNNANYKAFFESYAVTWRQITTKEYATYALIIDVHSPNKVRVNAVLPQFQKFYDTYGITEKDGMYVKPGDRIGIW